LDWAPIPIFIALGCAVGFLAGLLGVGGATMMIPVLTIVFVRLHFPPEHLIHIAIATSMATILFTSLSSARAHHRRGAVLWPVVWALAPGILIGSFLAPQLVAHMSAKLLATVFAVFAGGFAVQMSLELKPKATRSLPGKLGLFSVGTLIGVLSSLVGAGGAFVSVPFMTMCNVRIHNAVGTSAALGFPIAAAGTAGFVVAGLRQQGLPAHTLGYVYLPALGAIVVASMLTAPLGVRLAHSWPVAKLRRAFAALLVLLAAYMLWQAWS